MKERLLAELDARIARHVRGDSAGVLDAHALGIVKELTELGEPDAGSLTRVAALHLCRYEALPREHADTDLRMAHAIYTTLHRVDPRLVPPGVRELFGLAAPAEQGVALLREYERTGAPEHLERAISLFRQEVVEQRADSAFHLAVALLHRFERTGRHADRDEAVALGRAALAATPADHPDRAERQTWLHRATAHDH
ncbi:hypothetical protein [Actinophytocola sp. KF-1]